MSNETKMPTAATLQLTLAEALAGLRTGDISPKTAHAMAQVSATILRTVHVQIKVAEMACVGVTQPLADFAGVEPKPLAVAG